MKLANGFICALLLLLFSTSAIAQKNAQTHWFFTENNNGIFFNQNTLQPRYIYVPNNLNIGQSAVASDIVTGELIFYTDGEAVYDKYHRQVNAGNLLNANTEGPQAVAVSSVPGEDNVGRYYIFTNSASLTTPGDIYYSIYDTALYGAGIFPEPPVGNLNPAAVNIPITGIASGTSSPAMLVVPNATFDGFWLLSHSRGTTNYLVTELGIDGSIGATTTYSIPGAPNIAHTFSYSDSTVLFDSNLLTIAIAPQDNSQLTLVSLDPATGIIDAANAQFIPGTNLSLLPNENIFDTEFSKSGDYLYASGNFNSTSDSLLQFNLTDPAFPVESLNTPAGMARSYGLQRGPDNRIYHLYEASGFNLGRINDPDSIAGRAFYSRNAIGDNVYRSRQFAAFLPKTKPYLQVSFEVAGNCANSPVVFLPEIIPGADSVLWDFGDGNSASSWSASNTYAQGGSFNVTLFAFSNGDTTIESQLINIQNFDFSISGVPSDTTVCPGDFPLSLTAEGQGEASVTYQWSNLETEGPTTSIDSSGNYYVVATDPSTGCSAYASTRVQEYGIEEQRAFVWYFGEHAGIDFNPLAYEEPGSPVPIPFGDPDVYNGGNQLIAPEGTAIYCDANGFPIVYSDGHHVYDRQGNLVAELSGDPGSTQSVMILEYPGDATLYYIFTTESVYGPVDDNVYELRYSIFDLKMNNGLGGILENNNGEPAEVVLMKNSTERITGGQNWIIAHEYGNNIFRSFELTSGGIEAPVISQVGSVHPTSDSIAAHGYMRLSTTNTLAVALPVQGENYIEVFDFDSMGVIDNFRQINVSDDYPIVNGNMYGLEFNNSGDKIFASLNGGTGSYIVEYWLDSLDNPVAQPDPPIQSTFTLGALQVGPDGSIYVAVDGQQFLGTINPTPDTSFVSQFNEQGFPLAAGTLSQLGLPNFISQYGSASTGATALGNNGCPGEDIEFSATGTSTFDQYIWNVYPEGEIAPDAGPSASGPGSASSFTFSSPNAGNYQATVLIYNQCENSPDTTLVIPFVVYDPPAVNLTPQDASACGAEDGQLDVAMGFSGPYSYSIRNTSGEIIDGGFDVTDPNISLTGLEGGVYTVFVIEHTNGCRNTVDTTLNETDAFQITDTATENANCEGINGTFSFAIDGIATLPANYTLYESSTGNIVVSDASATNNVDGILVDAGTYYLEVTDDAGCSDFINDIIVQRPDTATLLTDPFISACGVQEIKIGAVTTNGEGITWENNSSLGDSIMVNEGGLYNVMALGDDINTCDNSKVVSVIFSEESDNPFGDQYIVCPDDPIIENAVVKLTPGNNFIYTEYFTEDDIVINPNTPGFDFAGDTLIIFTGANIRVELTNSFGCVTEANIAVLESCEARLTIPNAFIPSSTNELNRYFSIYSKFINPESFQIIIFNRWGEIIYESNDPDFTWDGTKFGNGNELVPQGTYAYVIRYISEFEPQLGPQTERGGILILR